MIYLYTDGSSNGGIGQGGYGWIVVIDNEVWMAGFGTSQRTTNNLMELEAAIKGIEYLIEHPIDDPQGITIMSDSQYVLGIADGTYTPHKNIDEAMKLRSLASLVGVRGQWVKGHSGDVFNDAADSLAKMGKRGFHKNPKQKRINKKRRKEMANNG